MYMIMLHTAFIVLKLLCLLMEAYFEVVVFILHQPGVLCFTYCWPAADPTAVC